MGYGLPAAVGVTSVSDQKIYLFESDGSLMMNLQELQTLKTLNRPMTIFLLNNEGYASIRATQENYFEGRFVGTGPSSRLEMPQFEKVADAFGFDYIAISDIDHVDHQIGQAVAHQGLLICEVFVRKDEKLMPKCSVIRTNDNQLLSAPIEDMTPLLSIDEFKSIMGDQIDPLSVRIRS
jgi:acetolactate synthase-1/2/3 large subunit